MTGALEVTLALTAYRCGCSQRVSGTEHPGFDFSPTIRTQPGAGGEGGVLHHREGFQMLQWVRAGKVNVVLTPH